MSDRANEGDVAMSAPQPDDQAEVTPTGAEPQDGQAEPKPAPRPQPIRPYTVQPATWNNLFYAILVVSVLVGLFSLLSGASLIDAFLRLCVSLMAMSVLGIVFLSSVVTPLYASRHQRYREQQREAAAARHREQSRDIQEHFRNSFETIASEYATTQSPADQPQAAQTQAGVEESVEAGGPAQPTDREAVSQSSMAADGRGRGSSPVEDQASGLRRMVTSSG